MAASLYIAGPTATGKSAIAIAVAQEVGGEIISVDSMQVYRRMNIGTAKPSTEEQATTPHHLIDIMEITEPFDAATFVEKAKKAQTKFQPPIFCGGTGLYFKAWLEGLGEAPGANEEVRAEIETMDTRALLAELREKDPATYQDIDHQNRRRLVRAVEVFRLTGKPFSGQRAEWTSKVPGNFFVLHRDSEDLRQRIELRVDAIFTAGLVDETRELLPSLEQNRTAQQALGYKQVIEHLRGERDLPATIALVKSRTWQFARRQKTWFRKMRGAIPIEVAAGEAPANTSRRVIDSLR